VEEVLEPLRAALPVDGVLLSLHGAFCAQDRDASTGEITWRDDDSDGYILAKVRELVGVSVPIFSVHDLHCNISQTMVDAAVRGKMFFVRGHFILKTEYLPRQARDKHSES
jgi:microcystin degradation protein MlrC